MMSNDTCLPSQKEESRNSSFAQSAKEEKCVVRHLIYFLLLLLFSPERVGSARPISTISYGPSLLTIARTCVKLFHTKRYSRARPKNDIREDK